MRGFFLVLRLKKISQPFFLSINLIFKAGPYSFLPITSESLNISLTTNKLIESLVCIGSVKQFLQFVIELE